MRLIVVNDRSFVRPVVDGHDALVADAAGTVRGELDPGGLATALTRRDLPKLFVGSVRGAAQARLAVPGGVGVAAGGETFRVRLVRSDPDAYRRFYDVAANRLLWLLHHGCWPLTEMDSSETSVSEMDGSDVDDRHVAAYHTGYRVVNANLARAVVEEVEAAAAGGERVHVLWQDYQLYLAPAMARAALSPGARASTVFQHFLHVPFPPPAGWAPLPAGILRELLSGLLGNDLVGFQLPEYAGNFVQCCRETLGLESDEHAGVVRLPEGRWVRAASYPIPVSAEHLRAAADRPRTRALADELRQEASGRRIVFRTERVDPVKAFPAALRAFAELLRHPGMPGTVLYAAQLVPSRVTIPEWTAVRRESERLAAEINARADGPPPVRLRFESDFERVAAGYLEYDVLDVVPRADGMNLVALEGPVLNRRDGALVLSRTAGAHRILSPYDVAVEPGIDAAAVRRHADALHRALTMPATERARRARAMRARAAAGDPSTWLLRQVDDGARWTAAERSAAHPPTTPVVATEPAAGSVASPPAGPAPVAAPPAAPS